MEIRRDGSVPKKRQKAALALDFNVQSLYIPKSTHHMHLAFQIQLNVIILLYPVRQG